MARTSYSGIVRKASALTPQTRPIPGKKMTPNDAGGYSFSIDPLVMLERFLILGSESSTYYVGQKALTTRNIASLSKCLESPAKCKDAIDLIVSISKQGRAPKNDHAIFALAIAASYKSSNPEYGYIRSYALSHLGDVCRTGTHLLMFASLMDEMRGWGRSVKKAMRNWYFDKNPERLAYQLAKYQNREGWTHKDIFRMAHVKSQDASRDGSVNNLVRWVVGNPNRPYSEEKLFGMVKCLELMKKASSEHEVIDLIYEYKAPWEIVPTQYRNSADVWEAMLPTMGGTAMIRNLGNMSRYGVFNKVDNTGFVISKLTDLEFIKRNRIHPLAFMVAKIVYSSGSGMRSDQTWAVNRDISLALENGFYKSFGTLEPTGKRIFLGLDVSGSMGSGEVAGISGFYPALATGVMSMVTLRTEPNSRVMGFDTGMIELGLKKEDTLEQVLRNMTLARNGGGTDVSKAISYAYTRNEKYDAFVIYTDNESRAGIGHASEWIKKYRSKFNSDTKVIFVAMTAGASDNSDPEDKDSLNVVGFDVATPNLISDFIRGNKAVYAEDESEVES